jgi:PadR family transcriptional regulator PadR
MSHPAKDRPLEPQNLARSCNEALILACLESGPMHGYQIAIEIQERGRGFFRFNFGTLYPILHQMEKDGLVSGTWSPETRDDASTKRRRKRKQYVLTEKGRRYASDQRSSWRDFIANFLHVLGVNEQ